uniref:Uncharacterized protein n=1 Tax=viral metagenome TaxID=1070528 RepID=A0A6C0B4S3_9ZZZZ
MPYRLRKVSGKKCYRVLNKRSKKVFAKCTSKARANKQLRLLRAIENNKNFVPYSSMRRTQRAKGK